VAALRARAALALSAAAFAFAGCAASSAAEKHPDLPRVEALVVEGTNAFRREQRLAPVERNALLEKTARDFAEYMARTGKFDHDADGSTPMARAKRHGYDYCVVAENIARQYSSRGFATAELGRDLVQGWENSPGHRHNMADPAVTQIGVAIAHRTHEGLQDYYAVQLFGRPASEAVRFVVRNETGSSLRYRVGEKSYTLGPRYARTHTECDTKTLEFEAPLAKRYEVANNERYVAAMRDGKVGVFKDAR
jgi:uncharacterized protein YkwD